MKQKTKPIMDWSEVPVIMDFPMASRILAIHPETIKRWSRQGKFPGKKVGVEWRVEKKRLLKWLESPEE